jgi:CDR ABC transporter
LIRQALDPQYFRAELGPNQACTLFGSQGNVTSGAAYLSAGYGIDVKDLWRRDFLVLIGFFILFQLTQIFILEFFPVCSFRFSNFDHTEYGNIRNTVWISRLTYLRQKQKRPKSLMRNFAKRNFIGIMVARNKVHCRNKES